MFPRVSDAQDVCAGFRRLPVSANTITAGRVWCSGSHTAPLSWMARAWRVQSCPLQPRLYRNHFLSLEVWRQGWSLTTMMAPTSPYPPGLSPS